jgi:hypothetical protein
MEHATRGVLKMKMDRRCSVCAGSAEGVVWGGCRATIMGFRSKPAILAVKF